MIEDILSETNTKMGKSIEALGKELATIRTGRATPSLVDQIKVDYHGVPTLLNQMATISGPEARMGQTRP